MKTFRPIIILAGFMLTCMICLGTVWIGSLTTVNNTTSNSSAVQLGTFYAPLGTFTITNTGLTATTALVVNWQLSLDGANYTNVATWSPPVTNPATYSVSPSYSAVGVNMRVQVITTNSVTLGIF